MSEAVFRLRISPPPAPPSDYDVVVKPGVLAELPALLAEVAPAHRYAVVADATVAGLYGERVMSGLAGAGLDAELVMFPAGEQHKTRESWAALTDALLERRFGRDGCVVALGGGVTGDLAAFVAATYMRGIPVVQVPTTLLAMVDASIGGKTGVDAPAGKNLVGAFHHPRAVIMDPEVLQTLPDVEFRAGLVEAVKHGAIADAGYFWGIEEAAERIFSRDPVALTRLVERSVEIKAGVVAEDPYERGARKALNFGHTVGHALETLRGYSLPHGFAVAIGMVAEAEVGEAAGITEPGTAEALRRVLTRLGLPVELPADVPAEAILATARLDKKARQSRIRYTLLARLGAVARMPDGDWSMPVEDDVVVAVLAGRAQRGAVEPERGSGVSPDGATV
jgi:3-dehydroquinate synthase